jgi:hypothetical protein
MSKERAVLQPDLHPLGNYLRINFGKPTKTKFTDKQKKQLRPIAEVLAIIDGNAFFGMSVDESGEDNWYEQYLPEAWQIFKTLGQDKGWISQASWMKDLEHENDSVRQAHEHWRLLKQLSRKR